MYFGSELIYVYYCTITIYEKKEVSREFTSLNFKVQPTAQLSFHTPPRQKHWFLSTRSYSLNYVYATRHKLELLEIQLK